MGNRKCVACHADMDPDAIFCNECGLAQAAPQISSAEPPPRSGGHSFVASERIDAPSPAVPHLRSCPRCGKQGDISSKFCSGCAFDLSSQPETAKPPSPLQAFVSRDGTEISGELRDAVRKRYKDGFRVARAMNGYGALIKGIGFLLGIIICLAGVVVGGAIAEQANRSPLGGPGVGAGIVVGFVFVAFGVIVAIIFWIIGVINMAQAQKLKASLDGAVNSSPFLSDLDRAEMMSLPIGNSERKANMGGSSFGSFGHADPSSNEINESVRISVGYAVCMVSSLLGPWGLLLVPVYIYLISTTPSEYPRVLFNAYQSMLLSFTVLGLGVIILVLSIATNSQAIGLTYFLVIIGSIVLNILCLMKAHRQEMFVIPLVGDLAMSLAGRKTSSAF